MLQYSQIDAETLFKFMRYFLKYLKLILAGTPFLKVNFAISFIERKQFIFF